MLLFSYHIHQFKHLFSALKKNRLIVKSMSDIEPRHEISNNVVCATSKASDQSALTRSLIRAFASRLYITVYSGYLEFQGTGQNMSSYQ